MNHSDSQDEKEHEPGGVVEESQANPEVISAVVVESPATDDSSLDRKEPTAEGESSAPKMRVGVKLADGKVVDFDPGTMDLSMGDTVVVNNDRDLNLGVVCYIVPNLSSESLRPVVRKVGSHDLLLMRRNAKREEEAFEYCNKRIAERELPMKLVRTAFLHGGNKAIFFFTADGRVDFRALVRDLAQQLHVRIEMRQIGVRDEARLLGGVGICGQPLCCSRYLRKFIPVSIKMAKNQGLALNPQKVSGLCGRLMCCLVYEDDTYSSLRKEFPKPGKMIDTPVGTGKVLDSDVLAAKIRVSTESGLHTFTKKELEEGPAEREERLRKAAEKEARMAARQEQAEQRPNRSKRGQSSKKNPRGVASGRGDKKAGEESRSASSEKRRRKKRPSGASSNKAADKAPNKNAAQGQGKAGDAGQQATSKKLRSKRRSRRRRKKKSSGTGTETAQKTKAPDVS